MKHVLNLYRWCAIYVYYSSGGHTAGTFSFDSTAACLFCATHPKFASACQWSHSLADCITKDYSVGQYLDVCPQARSSMGPLLSGVLNCVCPSCRRLLFVIVEMIEYSGNKLRKRDAFNSTFWRYWCFFFFLIPDRNVTRNYIAWSYF